LNKVLIAPTTFSVYNDQPIDLLKSKGFNLIMNEYGQKLSSTQLIELCRDCTGVVAGTEIYSKDIINQLSSLKVISRLGVGMDNIDLKVARERNIKVFKTTTTPAKAVAELVLGLLIDVARNISNSNKNLKIGKWKKQMGSLLQGKTLGIIGLGSIGKVLVQLSSGFHFKILAFDQHEDELFAKENDVAYCDLETLLKNSDFVSIHLNLSDGVKYLINKDNIKLMKRSAILINTSRGEILDEKVLYDALISNHLAGAGLDVFEQEPYSGPLTELNNVILTPHIGSYAREIRIQMEKEATKNLIRGLNEAK